MHGLTMHARLTLAYAVILAVALLAFSGAAFIAVRTLLGAQLEARLQTTASAVQTIPDVRHGRVVLDPDDRLQFQLLLAENHVDGTVLADDGRLVFSSGGSPAAAVVDAARWSSVPHRGDVRVGGQTVAFQSEPIRGDGRTYGAVVVWSSRAFNDDIAWTSLLGSLAATLFVVAVAVAVGGRLSRQLLRPLSDMSALIAAIAATDLSERLAWNGPDDELGRLCSTFDRLLDRLEAAFEQQRRFTADASHELRTPLSVMRAEIELALARDRDAAAYVEALERLQAETQRLEALVEGLLLAARGDAVTVTAGVVDLDDVARRVVDRMTTPARIANVTIACASHADAHARAEQPLVESAVLALIDNAISYTPAGGSVHVMVGVDAGTAYVSVADGGAGFTAAALHAATHRFWRDDASRSRRGAGLGLSIARTIAERHGGSLVVRNATNGGGIVTLMIPHT
jgi:two-component system OmpR family sensor kinase